MKRHYVEAACQIILLGHLDNFSTVLKVDLVEELSERVQDALLNFKVVVGEAN